MNNSTVAIILAAGSGSRLLPATLTKPKCLVEIAGFPILYYQLTAMREYHINSIYLVVGYRKKQIKKYMRDNFPDLKIKYIHNPIYESTNTLYSLALASQKIPENTNVLLLNGDVIFDKHIIKKLLEENENLSYSAVEFKKCGREEIKITQNKDGSIRKMNKKISSSAATGESVGILKFSQDFWEKLSNNLQGLMNIYSKNYFEYAAEKTINDGVPLYPFDIKKLIAIEIDFIRDIKKAEISLLNSKER